MWVDEAKIHVASGRGGNGLTSFHRTRTNPRGTPDGGSGGRGGDVLLRATRSVGTLLQFQNQIHFRAGHGGHGGPNCRQGKDGTDLVIHVPVGTVVRDAETGEILADLATDGAEARIARGGRGGRGNKAFTNSARQAPRIREFGEEGEERWIKLELRVLADVGIIGFPNVGKSSLLARVSRRKVKVAPYPFTTLAPNLGLAEIGDGTSLVLADLPGLIEGAHEGKGLGDRFLRHATRARVLLHVVDLAGVEGRDPLADHRLLRREIEAWEELRTKPEVVAGNKADLLPPERVSAEVHRFREAGIELHPISAVTGRGIRELLLLLGRKLQENPLPLPATEAPARRAWQLTPDRVPFEVVEEEGQLVVRGPAVERLVRRLDLSTRDAQEYFEMRLERLGVLAALKRRGLRPGSTVRIGGQEFELTG
ncbi:MAG TPA: GTPase ObgE [Candidatus Bipolaricaulis sp.]|nr:GTPase ObgE [Candidatus Bipolaricaulis sp.]HRS14514.1 GTPase ObgE [Candidatus Bipolaricaulis sp.]HRU21332.1 GTPase ObgE [Candidatus Bipolaricaulis sp.]